MHVHIQMHTYTNTLHIHTYALQVCTDLVLESDTNPSYGSGTHFPEEAPDVILHFDHSPLSFVS